MNIVFNIQEGTVKPVQTTTSIRQAMLSPPKQIPIHSLLYKLITCLTQPVTTFYIYIYINLYISSHGEARNIKFRQQVGKPHSKDSLGYPTSRGTDIIASFSHDFDKSILSLVTRAPVIEFGQ